MRRTFRRLQWRMTCSYLLVTIPAIVLMQACFLVLIGGAFYAFLNSQLLAEEQAVALTEAAPQAAPYLGGPAPDHQGLSKWLLGSMCSGPQGAAMFPADAYPAVLHAAVVDVNGHVLADTSGAAPGGAVLAERLDARGQKVLEAALDGHTQPQYLALRQADDAIVAAAPIKDASQRVLGAWFVNIASTPLPRLDEALWVLLVLLVPLSFLAACFTIGLGSIYGWLTSRNLVQRIRGLSAAADTWSGGDFRAVANDRSEDELGHLSRQFNAMAEKLQALVTTRQELAALEERNRLARDLHDSVKQQLFAVSMQLGSARTLLAAQPAVDGLLARAESLTQAAQQEVTATIHALRPAALPEGGIAEALRVLAEQWSQQHAIDAQLECSGNPELPPLVEQALFRVAQESLANVARHSGARYVTLSLVVAQQATTLTVSDNGQGFDPQAAPDGIGLQSMRERVASCGGTLTIDSRPGAGTHISARFPAAKEQQHG